MKPVNDSSGEKQDEVQLGYLSLANCNSIRTLFLYPCWWSVIFVLASVWDQSKSFPNLPHHQKPTSYLQSTAFPMLSHSSDSNVTQTS